MSRLVRIPLTMLVAAALAWWLLADTLRRRGLTVSPRDAARPCIRFMHFGGYEDYTFWEGVIGAFMTERPGVAIEQRFVPGAQSLYMAKLRQQLQSGDPPEVALVQLGPFADVSSRFADLSEALTPAGGIDEFDATGLDAFRDGDALRALPVSGGALAVFLNLDALDRAARARGTSARLPTSNWTIEEFRALAEWSTIDEDGDGTIDQFGLWLPRWVYALPLIWSFGADVLDPSTGAWALSGPQAERAVSFYKGLMCPDRVCPREDETPQVFQDVGFLTGQVAMCINGPWFESFLARTSLAKRYAVAPVPRGPAGRWTRVTWDGVAVANELDPKHRSAAESLAMFLLSDVVQNRLAVTGRGVPACVASQAVYARVLASPGRAVFADAMTYARLQPSTRQFMELDAMMNRHLHRFIGPSDARSAREFLTDVQADPLVRRAFAPESR